MRGSSLNISSETGGEGGGRGSQQPRPIQSTDGVVTESGGRRQIRSPVYLVSTPPFGKDRQSMAGIFRPFPFPVAFRLYAFVSPTKFKNVIGPIRNLGQSRLRTYVCSYVSVCRKDQRRRQGGEMRNQRKNDPIRLLESGHLNNVNDEGKLKVS